MIRLTSLQADFLSHRLAVPCAIADALTDAFPGERSVLPEKDREKIERSADNLCKTVENTLAIVPANLSKIDRHILSDCFEGSTWFDGFKADVEDSTRSPASKANNYNAAVRSIKGLADKLRAAGLTIDNIPFPVS